MKALLIVLAILVLLAWIPLKCCARYLGSPQVDLRVGPLRFAIYPSKEKPKKKPKTEKPTKQPKEQQPAQQKKSFTPDAILQYVPLAQTALNTLGRLCRSIAVKVKLHVTYGAEDPADAAVRYGQAWAIIGAITPILERTFHIKKRDMQAIFDPEETGFSIETDVQARLFVWQIIAIVVSVGGKILIQFLKIRKGGANK
ncbi:MAG: DUF2953 domain-containing protein [Ruminococcaceae bacterium]|nr:DUF2953 domain-containing protein [Oscillospiraceae bacterium]